MNADKGGNEDGSFLQADSANGLSREWQARQVREEFQQRIKDSVGPSRRKYIPHAFHRRDARDS